MLIHKKTSGFIHDYFMINFYLPGISKSLGLNIITVKIMKEYPTLFRENAKISAFFGEFPVSLWNGGRSTYRETKYNKEDIDSSIALMKHYGIDVCFTFSNMLITEADLNDEFCNYCLQAAHNEKNAIILTSPLLEQYIRENYPKYQIISSTCKCIQTWDRLNKELDKNYNLVVVDYNFNHDPRLFEIKQKEKCEILINPKCKPNCDCRYQHYMTLSKIQKQLAWNVNHDEKKEVSSYICPYSHYNLDENGISPDELWNTYVPAGFSNFKIQGRTADAQWLINTYCKYLVKPEFFEFIKNKIYEELIKANLLQFMF